MEEEDRERERAEDHILPSLTSIIINNGDLPPIRASLSSVLV